MANPNLPFNQGGQKPSPPTVKKFVVPVKFQPPKFSDPGSIPLTSKERITLIHRGNEIFNLGRVETAERIFRTARYQDGMVRVAEHYFSQKQYLRAADLFRYAKYLRGEYKCYLKLGLIKELDSTAFSNEETRMKLDLQINKKLAAVVSRMMKL
jgi:hypothetical protein